VLIQHNVREYHAFLAQLAAVEDASAAVNDAAGSDFYIGTHERLGMNFGALCNSGCRANVSRRTDAGKSRLPWRMQMGDDVRERRVYITYRDKGPVVRLKASGHDDG